MSLSRRECSELSLETGANELCTLGSRQGKGTETAVSLAKVLIFIGETTPEDKLLKLRDK